MPKYRIRIMGARPNEEAVLVSNNLLRAEADFRDNLNDWADQVELDLEELHEFVVRTKDGQFVGPFGVTPKLDEAVRFDSRRGALAMCSELGAVMDGASIRDYDQLAALGEPGQGNPSSSG